MMIDKQNSTIHRLMKSWALKKIFFCSINEQRIFQTNLPKYMLTSFTGQNISLFYFSTKQRCFEPRNPTNAGLQPCSNLGSTLEVCKNAAQWNIESLLDKNHCFQKPMITVIMLITSDPLCNSNLECSYSSSLVLQHCSLAVSVLTFKHSSVGFYGESTV